MAAVSLNAEEHQRSEGMKVFSVHPANNTGKMMTMEQAVYSGELRPERFRTGWYGENTIVYMKDGKPQLYDVNAGKDVDADEVLGEYAEAAGAYLKKSLPEGAENVTPNEAAMSAGGTMMGNRAVGAAPALAFTVGKSLY